MSITLKRPMFRMGGQARSEDTGITSGLRQPYQVGRLVTDESGSYENYPYGVSPSPDLMGVGAAANALGLLNSFSKANPASSFFPKLDQEGEAEPVSIEDKINRIKKQYEVTPRDDFNALIEGVGQGFSGAYTLGEALNKAAQARRQIIDPRAQRAQDVAAKLDLLPLEQSYKEKLQMLKNGLLIPDECHIASGSKMTIAKTLKEAGILDVNVLELRNIKILDISATPDAVLHDYKKWDEETFINNLKDRQEESSKKITQSILDNSNIIRFTSSNPKEIDAYTFYGMANFDLLTRYSVEPYNSSDNTGTNQNLIKLYIGEDIDNYYFGFFPTNDVRLTEENILLQKTL
jgi:hypothetical protein